MFPAWNEQTVFWKPWSVETINEIHWNASALPKTHEKGKKEKPNASKDKGDKSGNGDKTGKGDSTENVDNQEKYFNDNEIFIIPRQFLTSVWKWKRPGDFFPDAAKEELTEKITIYSGSIDDLYPCNVHLESSSYYNHILDAFTSLILYEDFEKEDMEEFGFTEWKPTNHIYAMDKVPKAAPHTVRINPFGKYVVRLFHCGKWRAITVDDRIPVDSNDQILLPCIRNEKGIELWPLLISKAILKLNLYRMIDDGHYYLDQSKTPQCRMFDHVICDCKELIPVRKQYLLNESDIDRLNAVYLLTSWYQDEMKFSGVRAEKVCEMFQRTFEIFEYPPKPEIVEKDVLPKGGKRAKRKKSELQDSYLNMSEREPRLLMTLDIKLGPNEIREQRLYMEVLCSMLRLIPLEENIQIPQPLPLWKTYRWKFWAMEKGIWTPNDEKVNWSLLCSVPKARQAYFEHLFEKEWVEIRNRAPSKQAPETETIQRMSGEVEKKKGKQAKKAAKKIEEEVKPPEQTPKDSNKVWIDFNKFLFAFERLKIYSKDHKYLNNIFISNEREPITQIQKGTKDVHKGRGESAERKRKTMSVASVAHQPIQRFYASENDELYVFIDQEDDSELIVDLTAMIDSRVAPEAKVKIEKFDWKCTKQVVVLSCATRSSIGQLIDVPRGRIVYRLTFGSGNFCLHVKTNCLNIRVVPYSKIFDLMSEMSTQFTEYLTTLSDGLRHYMMSTSEPDFVDNMQEFYSRLFDIIPAEYRDVDEIRKYVFEIIRVRLYAFFKRLGDSNTARVMRRFFISTDPKWVCYPAEMTLGDRFLTVVKEYNIIKKLTCICPGEPPAYTEAEEEEIRQCAAIKIQAYMKRFHMKQLLRYHVPIEENREFNKKLSEDLRHIYDKYCKNRKEEMQDWFIYTLSTNNFERFSLNHLILPHSMATNIIEMSDLHEDLRFSVRKTSFNGEIPKQARANTWYPLKVGCLYSHAVKLSKYIIRARSSAPQSSFFVKIFNNDNLKEIFQAKLADLWLLRQNRSGYKIFIYMYCNIDLDTPHNWMLEIISPRFAPYAHFCNFCSENTKGRISDIEKVEVIDPFPILCATREMKYFKIFTDQDQCSTSEALICKYRIRIKETMMLSAFLSSPQEFFEFEMNIVQEKTNNAVASRTDLGRIDIIGTILRFATNAGGDDSISEFLLTAKLIRVVEPNFRNFSVGKYREHAVRFIKSLSDTYGQRATSGREPVDFRWCIKLAYDTDKEIFVERIHTSGTALEAAFSIGQTNASEIVPSEN